MTPLAFSIRRVILANHDGAYATQDNRARGLAAMADELKALGYGLKDVKNLKPAHVDALVAHWKRHDIRDATIRNRLGWVRWLAMKAGKPGLIPASNSAFGLASRTPYQGNRARSADAGTLARVSNERIRLALRLQEAFGLRREEALKLRPRLADKGDWLQLKASWCKGGRARSVPILSDTQRQLLREVAALTGDGSLIPMGSSYKTFLQVYKAATRAGGLGKAHGLRHSYAQRRYEALTGAPCPACGGRTADAMSIGDRFIDQEARLTISAELGHGRIEVTDTYLGRRWASGHFRKAAAS